MKTIFIIYSTIIFTLNAAAAEKDLKLMQVLQDSEAITYSDDQYNHVDIGGLFFPLPTFPADSTQAEKNDYYGLNWSGWILTSMGYYVESYKASGSLCFKSDDQFSCALAVPNQWSFTNDLMGNKIVTFGGGVHGQELNAQNSERLYNALTSFNDPIECSLTSSCKAVGTDQIHCTQKKNVESHQQAEATKCVMIPIYPFSP